VSRLARIAVTRIRVRFKRQDGTPYGFDPSLGPGYVWHCHIVDHEDNEMMRPDQVVAKPFVYRSYVMGRDY